VEWRKRKENQKVEKRETEKGCPPGERTKGWEKAKEERRREEIGSP
jgi:hypothetical protein